MGYDLHITRKEYWFDEERITNDITLEEWLLFIQSNNSELELSDAYWVKVPGDNTKSQPAPGFCEWTAHPQNERPWFHYSKGNISTKNPDEPTIKKMITMAQHLKAVVQGDNGEEYELSPKNEIRQ